MAYGIAPRVRIGRDRWFNLLWVLPIGFVLLIVAVAAAKGLRGVPAVQQFITEHPGTVIPSHAVQAAGIPAWAAVQHFFNLFLMVFIIRSGVQILSDHPRLYWTRHSTPGRDWFRIQKPVPADPLWTAKQDPSSLPGQISIASETRVIAYRAQQQGVLRNELLTHRQALAGARASKQQELAATRRQEQEWIAEARAVVIASAQVASQISSAPASVTVPVIERPHLAVPWVDCLQIRAREGP